MEELISDLSQKILNYKHQVIETNYTHNMAMGSHPTRRHTHVQLSLIVVCLEPYIWKFRELSLANIVTLFIMKIEIHIKGLAIYGLWSSKNQPSFSSDICDPNLWFIDFSFPSSQHHWLSTQWCLTTLPKPITTDGFDYFR